MRPLKWKGSSYTDYLFLFLFAVLAYWPISLMLLTAKGDAINYFLAMRYNSSEAIQHGFFPFWTPYINMGYPMHGDMQSGVWNPLVFLMSLFRRFDIYWLHTEMIGIIFIAGLSMYHLLKYFRLGRKTILAIAAAYMLSGYLTDAGQFQNWMYAAAYLPFVFLCLLRCFTSFSTKDAFLLGIAHLLMFLSAYPADFILLSYIIAGFAICSFIRDIRKEPGAATVKKYCRVILIALGVFVIAGLPAHLSFAQFFPLVKRGAGVDLPTALMNSLAPANLISFVTPWATMKGSAFAATDPLARNCYMGILTFIFFLAYLFTPTAKTFTQKFLLAIFILFLIFSLGELGGLRVWSYYVLPLMNTFRHPANAKLFFLFAGQVLAAFSINRYLLEKQAPTVLLKRIVGTLLLIIAGCMVFSFFHAQLRVIIAEELSKHKLSLVFLLRSVKEQLSFYDLLLLNSTFLFFFLLVTYGLLKKNWLARYFLPLMCVDLFIVAQMMLPLTYTQKTPVSEVQALLKSQPAGYPLPDNHLSLAQLSEGGTDHFNQIGCLNPYNKKPGRSDYIISPSNLATQEDFWQDTLLRTKLMQYPLAYFADTVFAIKDSLAFIADSNSLRRSALSNTMIKTGGLIDTSAFIHITRFDPNRFEFETHNNNPAFFVLMQNYYPNWKITVNDQEVILQKANLGFMGAVLPAGNNKIRINYERAFLLWLGLFSVVFVLCGLIYFYRPRKKSRI